MKASQFCRHTVIRQVHVMLLFWPTDMAFKPCGGPALTSSTHNLLSKMSGKGRIYQTKKRYEQNVGDSFCAHVQRCGCHRFPCWLHHGHHHGVQHPHAVPGRWSWYIQTLPAPPPPPPSSASDEITVSGQLVPMFTRNLETAQAYAVIGYVSAFRYPVCSFILCLYDLRNVECTNAACPQVPHVCIFVTKMY